LREGYLPNLATIATSGAVGQLQSTIPPNSAPAWTSFMTGMNPGKHGVYGFTRIEPEKGYTSKVNSGGARRARSIWQILTERGQRSVLVNVPMTYPPEPVNGFVVTGIDTPGLESEFTFPPQLRHEILSLIPDYTLDVRSWGVTAVGERRAQILDDILHMVDSRRQLALHLMTKQPWDLFNIVFTATDRAQHFFWRFLDPAHPLFDAAEAPLYHDAILRVYRQVDQALGEILSYCGEETTIIAMSDHGFGPQHKLFRINQWLRQHGFLALTYAHANSLRRRLSSAVQKRSYRTMDALQRLVRTKLSDGTKDQLKRLFPRLREQVASQILFSGVDWSATRAYHTAEIPGSIRINLKGRETNGVVDPGGEYDAVCEEIRSALESLVDPVTGQHIVERVFRRDELYWGPYLDMAPDLILHLADYAYTIDWTIPVLGNHGCGELPVVDALTGRYAVNCGSHRPTGILMLRGPDIHSGVDLGSNRIYDVAPTILYLLGQPVPNDMDGRILTQAITPERLARQPLERSKGEPASARGMASEDAYSEADSKAVSERLRSLGYL
jgi:predicted AlkP superfamily phosphohydrolase/phosphomutase